MTITFITFGNNKYNEALIRIKKEAESFNIFDNIIIYNEDYLKNDKIFWEKHGDFINNNNRGYGYWLWKSYLTLKTLENMNENDILLYCDAGCTLNVNGLSRFNDYLNIMKDNEILSFELNFLEKIWTKMDLFKYLDMDKPKYFDSKQLVGGIYFIKKTERTINIINEWYNIMSANYNLINDSKSIIINDISFKEHRHDQSVFSLLRKKYGSFIIKDETYFHNWNPNIIKKYPILATRKNK